MGLPSDLFLSGFPTKTLYALLSPIRATYPAHLILDYITRTILGEQYRSLSSSLCSFLHSPCYLVPLRHKYSPQHPILKHPQPTSMFAATVHIFKSSYSAVHKGPVRYPAVYKGPPNYKPDSPMACPHFNLLRLVTDPAVQG